MNNFFESINPDKHSDDDSVEVAENYWPRKARDLLPGQIVHPSVSTTLAMDKQTRKLYISSGVEFDAGAHAPGPEYGGRFGIMRIYQPGDDGITLDGYIVDIRPVSPGDLRAYALFGAEGADNNEELATNDLIPVAGCVYLDVEGSISYSGDERLLDAAQFLAETVNTVALRQSTAEEESPSIENNPTHDEESAPIIDKDL